MEQLLAFSPWSLVLPVVGGFLLGLFHFVTLWYTVRSLPHRNRPFLMLSATTLVRLAIVLTGFVVISQGQFERLLACLAAFLVARYVVLWKFGAVPGRKASRDAL